MGLKATRQTHHINYDFVNPFQTERGGFASIVSLSGFDYATYEFNPNNNTKCLGIQEYDFEGVDLAISIPPWTQRNAYPPFSVSPIIIEGEVITNFIHPVVTSITPGDFAYLAPSGMVTNTPAFTNIRVGRFLSALNDSSLGAAVGPSKVRVGGDVTPKSFAPTNVNTAGWAKIHVQVL